MYLVWKYVERTKLYKTQTAFAFLRLGLPLNGCLARWVRRDFPVFRQHCILTRGNRSTEERRSAGHTRYERSEDQEIRSAVENAYHSQTTRSPCHREAFECAIAWGWQVKSAIIPALSSAALPANTRKLLPRLPNFAGLNKDLTSRFWARVAAPNAIKPVGLGQRNLAIQYFAKDIVGRFLCEWEILYK